ncbi:hypothetical protein D1164_08010 [Mariniphaga sediminis]|uniref:Porin n=1 Tax=Mariniphaga sediminis TaxID=1628158 RepID=A0A399D159_9BACT|nr:hypothetical protein [Mariniphaga sediminis]RIH65604.1 hypothetical protein D1164_08010 [Mariniphaga sediminis]
MNRLKYILLLTILIFNSGENIAQDFLNFKGQLSAYSHFNPNNDFPWWNGGRYIPEAHFEISPKEGRLFDIEASANLYGNIGMESFSHTVSNGKIKPYRMWARYSTNQFELRAGLQKINFGSASILRPLMWFDQLDPRDPLKLTDGVWGLLGRYYFLNNANIWLWILHGNNNPKGWEMIKTNRSVPEVGGRIQFPASTGEVAISYHYRTADSRTLSDAEIQFAKIPEHRVGFDAKFDWVVGCWVEASWTNMGKSMEMFTNQEIMNLGVDYTFGLGNGLTVIYEQLLAAYDEKAFHLSRPATFSLINASYPLGLFDNLSFIIYFDWRNKAAYNFINWQKQFNMLTLYVMGYVNPKNYNIPLQQAAGNLFAGTGIQLMLVFNH